MKIILLLLLLVMGCDNSGTRYSHKNEALKLLILDCLQEYKTLNPLYPFYTDSIFKNYSASCDNVIIGDSTMDYSRVMSFYDPVRTYNYAIAGNTACDYLYQLEAIKCYPKNVLIATPDGNGVIKNISCQTSVDTIRKVITIVKDKWNPNIVIIGINPVLLTNVNTNKNPVNQEVSKLGACYINPLPIFGVTENQLPDSSLMIDQIHYQEIIYTKFKAKIYNQCGINF